MMRKFGRDELTRFLESLDRHMSEPRQVTVIGGAAASLAYGVTRVTIDIDTINSIADLDEAIKLARLDTGLDIPFHSVGIYDAPYHYEDRLISIDAGLNRLLSPA